MTYKAVLKQNNGFTVPEAIFNEMFGAFEKSYNGKVGDHEAPAWRAFDIAFKRGELDGNTKPDDKSNRLFTRKRSKGRSDTSDDGSGQVGAD